MQAVGEGEPYAWLSDDYALVWASDEESALLQHERSVEHAITCSQSSPVREDTKASLAHSSVQPNLASICLLRASPLRTNRQGDAACRMCSTKRTCRGDTC